MDTDDQAILTLRAAQEMGMAEARLRAAGDDAKSSMFCRISNETVNAQQESETTGESASQDAVSAKVSEMRYWRVFQAADHGVLIVNAESGEIEDVSPFLCGLLGFPPDHFIGKKLWESGAFRDIVANQDAFHTLQKRNFLLHDELPVHTKDGQCVFVEFVSKVYLSGDRKVLQCNIYDISERKSVEAVSARLAAVVESSDDVIISKTLDGVITTWNAGAQKLYGYTAQEAIGRPVSFLIPSDLGDEMSQLLEKVTRGEPIRHYETVRARKDGSRVDISLSISPLRDAQGNIVGASSIKRDITERNQSEALIRKSEANLANAQQIARLGSLELDLTNAEDLKQNSLRWSDETIRIFGLEPGQIEVSNENFFRLVHPDDRAQVTTAMSRAVRERTAFGLEYRILWPNDTAHTVQGQAEIVTDDSGSPIKMIGTVRDITGQSQAARAVKLWPLLVLTSVATLLVLNVTDWAQEFLLPHQGEFVARLAELIPNTLGIVGIVYLILRKQQKLHQQSVSAITERNHAQSSLQRQAEELARSNDELARFNRVAIGRELRMVEIKQQINRLSEQLGTPPPYKLDFLPDSGLPEYDGADRGNGQ